MIEVFEQFFTSFIHPFKTQEYLGERHQIKHLKDAERMKRPSLVIAESEEELLDEKVGINFWEVLSVSWLMVLVRAFYSLIAINIGIHTYRWVNEENLEEMSLATVMGPSYQKLMIFYLLLQVTFFPLGFFIFVKFWETLISFFAELFDKDIAIDLKSKEIVNNSMVGHLFLFIPIFGQVVNRVSFFVFLFAGLTKNLRLSTFQAFLVMLSPLFLIFMITLIGAMSLMMLLNIY